MSGFGGPLLRLVESHENRSDPGTASLSSENESRIVVIDTSTTIGVLRSARVPSRIAPLHQFVNHVQMTKGATGAPFTKSEMPLSALDALILLLHVLLQLALFFQRHQVVEQR